MNKIFGMDSVIVRFANKAGDIIVLNLICICSFLLVIPAGAAITALYSVMFKVVRGEDLYVYKTYLQAFKKNFKQATIIWLSLIGLLLVTSIDFLYISSYAQIPMMNNLRYLFLLLSLVILIILLYAFALQSFFVNGVKQTVINSALMALKHFPYTILIVFIFCLPIVVLLTNRTFGHYALVYLTLIGISLPVYFFSKIFNRIFESYISTSGENFSKESD